MIKTIKEVVRLYFEPLTLAFWQRKPKAPSNAPSNAAFTAHQQREIDTSYEQLKEKIQGMRR
jgi:hypothetical protein